jgi:beta-glucosidase
MNCSLSPDERAGLVLDQMTLDEKLGMVHGLSAFGPPPNDPAFAATLARNNGGVGFIPGIPRLRIPDLNFADSTVGVTRGALKSRYSTLVPSTLALAATWDLDLARRYGALIGRELRDQGYNASLAGGLNITREPRNGRNFEYVGEDPVLAGTLVGHAIQALQDEHVIGDLKHLAANAQETGRMVANAKIDERSLRESDLLAFEIAHEIAEPGMVMAAYNRVNGDYASENAYLLSDVLKREWGFKGWVISDWSGTHSTVKAALAGLDMEMPAGRFFGPPLKEAIKNGEVPAERLDDMVRRILRSMFACGVIDHPPIPRVVDIDAGAKVAQDIAEASIVLLKNERSALPLDPAKIRSLALIGSHADVGILTGGGSAQVDPPGGNAVPPPPPRPDQPPQLFAQWNIPVWFPSSPLEALRERLPHAELTFHQGDDHAAAAKAASSADFALVFVHQHTSEGRDSSLSLPSNQDALVSAIAKANPQTLVVLQTGGPVAMPWIDEVPAVLAAWYPGARGGEAIARILTGEVNPAGKLAVTFPRSEADLPHPTLPGSNVEPRMERFPGAPPNAPRFPQLPPFDIDYTEGLKVGYKWFDAENKKPLFPFGHGLSYTTFSYGALTVTGKDLSFSVTNTGSRPGAEIAQVYVALPPAASEPPRRLVAWEKVALAPGESKTVHLSLAPKLLSIWDTKNKAWTLPPGEYTVHVGGSSRNTPLVGRFRPQ